MLVFRGVCFHIMFPFIFFWDSATVQLDATFLSGCVFWGKLGNRTQFQVAKWSVILLIFRPNLWSHLISIVCESVGWHVFRSFTSWSIYESIAPAQRLTLTITIAMIVSVEVEFQVDFVDLMSIIESCWVTPIPIWVCLFVSKCGLPTSWRSVTSCQASPAPRPRRQEHEASSVSWKHFGQM